MTENALLPCPFCGGSNLVVRETYKPLKRLEVFCRGNSTRACDAAMWGENIDRAICEWNTRAALSADPAPVSGVTVPVGAVEALANYQQGDMDGILVLVSRQAIEECLPALRAIAGENGND